MDVVMKGKRWFVAEEMKTVLLDSDEEVSAMHFVCLPGTSTACEQVD